MKRNSLVRASALGIIALALAACGGNGINQTVSTTTPPTPSLASQFGTQFAVDFQASPNSQPVKPAAGDIIPLNLTTAPVPLH